MFHMSTMGHVSYVYHHIYVCMQVHIHTHMYACMYTHTHMHARMTMRHVASFSYVLHVFDMVSGASGPGGV